jgi:pimeloyl-ACP methyl ester carboxylesterase
MPYADLPDIRLHYDTAGDGGTPVLLIMGFGVPGKFWKPQVRALSQHHQVAWFDNHGAGKSEGRRRRRPFTMRDFGRHAAGVMDALGWDQAHIVGISMGGMIAQELALGHRHKVRSLSLLVTHAGGLRNLFPSRRGVSLFVRGFLGPRAGRAEAMLELAFPRDYLETLDMERLRKGAGRDSVSGAPVKDRLSQMAAVLTHRTDRRLGELAGVPTLVIKAGRDVLIRPQAVDALHGAIPGARMVEYPHAGHAVLFQCADELNAELLAHFRSADEDAGAATPTAKEQQR